MADKLPAKLTVRVRYDGSNHVARARGKQASCAWSDSQAVRNLATRLGYKPGFDVVMGDRDADGKRTWTIVRVGNSKEVK
jgi:hypothetical protein